MSNFPSVDTVLETVWLVGELHSCHVTSDVLKYSDPPGELVWHVRVGILINVGTDMDQLVHAEGHGKLLAAACRDAIQKIEEIR